MTVLVDIRSLVSGVVSGVENYTVVLLSHLMRADTTNSYLFFFNRFRRRSLPAEWDFLVGAPVIDWRVPNKLLDLSLRLLCEPKIDRFIDADVIWSPHFNILATTARTKRVMTLHDLSFVHYPEFFPPRKRFWHWMQDVRGQAERATRLIAVSEFTKRDVMTTWHVPGEKIAVVHSGVNPFYRPLPKNDQQCSRFAATHGLKTPFILFVGTLEPRKNIPGLVAAFDLLKAQKAFRDLALVLVGRRGWLYDSVERAVARSPHRADIRLWGPAMEKELLFLYNLASVFAYPSFFEGFGFPVLEAQACGAPVVASDVSSLPEILGESALLVAPRETEVLAGAIERVLRDGMLRAALREKGFENVKRFSWERAARETLTVLETAAASY